MFVTLYRTDVPQQLSRAEYYQPHLDVEQIGQQVLYFVREKHAWYDDGEKKVVHLTTTLSPEEGVSSYTDAKFRFDQQVTHRASEGFIHLFKIDPFQGITYEKLDPSKPYRS